MGTAKARTKARTPQRARIRHPGKEIYRALVEKRGLSVTELADQADVSRVTLSRMLHEHAALSPTMAAKLEHAFGLPADRLLAAQAAYDLDRERRALRAAVQKSA